MYDSIKRFQKANNLKIDGYMNPGGPTERAIDHALRAVADSIETGPKGPPPGSNMPVIVPPNTGSNMPVIRKQPPVRSGPFIDKNGVLILDGINPKTGLPVRPPKGPL